MSTFTSLAKNGDVCEYEMPRNAFSAWHDPSYDVIDQMLRGQGLEIFRGDVKWWGKAIENGGIRPVNKYIPEKPQGVASTPPPPVPARVNP